MQLRIVVVRIIKVALAVIKVTPPDCSHRGDKCNKIPECRCSHCGGRFKVKLTDNIQLTLRTNGKSTPPSVNFSFMSRDCINLNREALSPNSRKNPNQLLRVATPLLTFEGAQN